MKFIYVFVCLSLIAGLSDEHVVQRAAPGFSQGHIVGRVTSSHIDEASGLAASRKHLGVLYTHNDHGGAAKIYAISTTTGQLMATFTLQGATSTDWEDITLGPCDATSNDADCIYIGDTGDSGPENKIYRFPEPDKIVDQTIIIDSSNTLQFRWGQPDCETLMIDPKANLYIISKVHNGHGVITQLPSSAWGSSTRVDVSSNKFVGVTSHRKDPVSGDISPNGKEVLVKTKEAIFYWNATGSSDYTTLLQTPGTKLPYTLQTRGEAICWDAHGSGYYTLGEGINEPLYYYSRQSAIIG